jgi:hypothetical protein
VVVDKAGSERCLLAGFSDIGVYVFACYMRVGLVIAFSLNIPKTKPSWKRSLAVQRNLTA